MKNSAMIEACLACFAACEMCATECIKMISADHLRCIALCRDCAEICALCIKLEQRDSEFSHDVMQLCVESCTACAAECEKFAAHHDHCRECAEVCRKCASECQAA
ncbi:four-helix bundle copper-binding protein [Flavobacterium album]|uniref:Four-helix bundle copper-binding protein n=1 Tax=Flavobacterium album TaxID=2175091 RepID=A0A2S1QZA7_9FLAO|nr:four-helix bundle copper-binding protein [Flavobacterium album]AWH85747.1 four-helix bundle copper-binding protein [Flavobacterium album]